ncbi:MAG: hypothetical protein ACE5OZ_25360 [Candidatus Heimdallarchaeota archaeon]
MIEDIISEDKALRNEAWKSLQTMAAETPETITENQIPIWELIGSIDSLLAPKVVIPDHHTDKSNRLWRLLAPWEEANFDAGNLSNVENHAKGFLLGQEWKSQLYEFIQSHTVEFQSVKLNTILLKDKNQWYIALISLLFQFHSPANTNLINCLESVEDQIRIYELQLSIQDTFNWLSTALQGFELSFKDIQVHVPVDLISSRHFVFSSATFREQFNYLADWSQLSLDSSKRSGTWSGYLNSENVNLLHPEIPITNAMEAVSIIAGIGSTTSANLFLQAIIPMMEGRIEKAEYLSRQLLVKTDLHPHLSSKDFTLDYIPEKSSYEKRIRFEHVISGNNILDLPEILPGSIILRYCNKLIDKLTITPPEEVSENALWDWIRTLNLMYQLNIPYQQLSALLDLFEEARIRYSLERLCKARLSNFQVGVQEERRDNLNRLTVNLEQFIRFLSTKYTNISKNDKRSLKKMLKAKNGFFCGHDYKEPGKQGIIDEELDNSLSSANKHQDFNAKLDQLMKNKILDQDFKKNTGRTFFEYDLARFLTLANLIRNVTSHQPWYHPIWACYEEYKTIFDEIVLTFILTYNLGIEIGKITL